MNTDKQSLSKLLHAFCNGATAKREQMSESYARLLRLYAGQFIRSLPDPLPAADSIQRAIVLFLAQGSRTTASNRTIATALCSFLEWAAIITPAHTERIIRRYPIPAADWSTAALSRQEQRELLDTLRTRGMQFSRVRDYMITATMLVSGIRVSQCTAVTVWKHTHSALVIEVQRQKNRNTQTRTKEIPLGLRLPDLTVYGTALEHYLRRRPKSDYLFPAKDGTKLSETYIRQFISKYAPFSTHPHALRHTAGTIVANNVSVPAAAALLDHASITTTMRYIAQPASTEEILRSAWATEEGESL